MKGIIKGIMNENCQSSFLTNIFIIYMYINTYKICTKMWNLLGKSSKTKTFECLTPVFYTSSFFQKYDVVFKLLSVESQFLF